MVDETKVYGSAISVTNVIKMVEYCNAKNYDHRKIRDIFSVNRQVLMSDL
ncbi:hypothetical protein JTT00_05790 [Clostridium botulinum]|nr:hypothetical protein [Clostridium botulinum]MCS4467596.1 hypothetical protein [Clostridium botulinum]MCS4468699.1 hypothetical protein [Clostridium botulinum]MCS4522769.1 hypothetical protein [Clostridium botulinum]